MEGNENERVILVSVVPSFRSSRGKGLSTETREIPFEHKKTLYTVGMTEHQSRLPREVMESPSSEMLKT